MRRGVWFVAGVAAGVYTVVKARRVAEAVTPDGLRDRAAGLALGAQLFGAEVRAGMAEKEAELRGRLGLEGPLALESEGVGGFGALAGARSSTADDDREKELT